MTGEDRITFFYAPHTRALGTRLLLEELEAPYDLQVMNLGLGESRSPAFLAVNPLGKVPTIRHRGTVVTEQVAIALYLGDLFPGKGLTPGIGDPARGIYLRWFVYYAACFEPAVADRAAKRDGGPAMSSPYGDFDAMLNAFEAALDPGPFLLGESLTLVDLHWVGALNWTMRFGLVPERPRFKAYVDRIVGRPSFGKVWEADEALAREQNPAAS